MMSNVDMTMETSFSWQALRCLNMSIIYNNPLSTNAHNYMHVSKWGRELRSLSDSGVTLFIKTNVIKQILCAWHCATHYRFWDFKKKKILPTMSSHHEKIRWEGGSLILCASTLLLKLPEEGKSSVGSPEHILQMNAVSGKKKKSFCLFACGQGGGLRSLN